MATNLTKPVYRETQTSVRDRSKRRVLIAGLEPGDVITLRLKGTRKSFGVTAEWLYYQAVKLEGARLVKEKAAKRAARKGQA